MSALALEPIRADRSVRWFTVLALASLALFARPDTDMANVVLPLIGVVGLLVPIERERIDVATWAGVTLFGVFVFWAGRELGPPYFERLDWFGVGLIAIAGIAEEALFRRGMYGLVSRRWGDLLAIAVTTIAFAVIHIPIYGWGSVAINLGAGAILGWQRWASRTWTAPAVTHTVANVMQAGWL